MAPVPLAHLVSHAAREGDQLGRVIKPGRIQLHPEPCRSTGQDAVGVIKGELQLLLPGLKIFLDARTRSAALL